MSGFTELLRSNRNYRFTWIGQVVSEVGDHYNNIAVFSLVLANTGSGLVVAGILLARGCAVMLGGPIAGVLLDRMDRKRLMITSDLVRAVIALLFILGIPKGRTWLLYVLSGCLMFASPFFTSGRAADSPVDRQQRRVAHREFADAVDAVEHAGDRGVSGRDFGRGLRLHAGVRVQRVFLFVFGAVHLAASRPARIPIRPQRAHGKPSSVRPWHEYTEGLRYMRATPLILGIGLVGVGWATGGGAAQILFSIFGEVVFQRGPDRDRHHLGMRGHRAGVRGALCELHWQADSVRIVQTRDLGVLRGSRRVLRSVQPGADVRGRAVFHRALARGRRRQLGAEHRAASAARLERFPGAGLLHYRDLDVGHYDGVHGHRRSAVRSRESANHRTVGGRAQFDHGDLLGLGQPERQVAGADFGRRRTGRGRGSRRSDGMNGQGRFSYGSGETHRPRDRVAPGERGRARRDSLFVLGSRSAGDGGGMRQRSPVSCGPGEGRRDRAAVFGRAAAFRKAGRAGEQRRSIHAQRSARRSPKPTGTSSIP